MRQVTPLLLILVVFAVIAAVGAPVSAAQTDIAIQSVNMSVDQPAPGEPFTLSVNVANLQSSSSPVEITDVYVRHANSGNEYARAENLGTIAAGSSLTVPLTVEIDDPGQKQLTVYAVVQGSDGNPTRVSYPLYVDVQQPDEAVVSFADLDSVADEQSTVNVTVANGDPGTLSNVRLNLDGDAVVENPERVNASLQAGTQTTYTYQVTFSETGEQTLDAELTYKTNQGSTRTVNYQTTVDVEAANVDTDLTATATETNGSAVIRTALTEYGNVELRDVQVQAVVDGDVVTRSVVPNVPKEGTQIVTLDGSDIPAGEVTLIAQYTAAGEQRTTNTTIQYSPRQASNIDLTGVEATRTGSTITLSGDAANLGSADANSVLLSVTNTSHVSPASPNGEYFVGTIESSEFATFDLTASTSTNGSIDSIPVHVSYAANGEQFERVVEVDVSGPSATGDSSTGAAQANASGGTSQSGGLPLMAVGIALVLVIIVGVGVYRWHRQ